MRVEAPENRTKRPMDEQGRRLLYGSGGRRTGPVISGPVMGPLTIRPSCVISISLGVSERLPRSLRKALSFRAHCGRPIESLGALISAQQRGEHPNLESNDESILRGRRSPFLLAPLRSSSNSR